MRWILVNIVVSVLRVLELDHEAMCIWILEGALVTTSVPTSAIAYSMPLWAVILPTGERLDIRLLGGRVDALLTK